MKNLLLKKMLIATFALCALSSSGMAQVGEGLPGGLPQSNSLAEVEIRVDTLPGLLGIVDKDGDGQDDDNAGCYSDYYFIAKFNGQQYLAGRFSQFGLKVMDGDNPLAAAVIFVMQSLGWPGAWMKESFCTRCGVNTANGTCDVQAHTICQNACGGGGKKL